MKAQTSPPCNSPKHLHFGRALRPVRCGYGRKIGAGTVCPKFTLPPVGLHGGVLAAINIGAILFAYGVYSAFKPADQVLFQGALAGISSVVGAALWGIFLSPAWPGRRQLLRVWPSLAGVWLVSLLWSPAIFFPLHYFTQGYVAAVSNVVAIWQFQAPVNAICVVVLYFILHRSQKDGPFEHGSPPG